MKSLRGHNAQQVLIRLNPIIRGWSAYYRHVVSAEVFQRLDYHMSISPVGLPGEPRDVDDGASRPTRTKSTLQSAPS